MGIKDIDDLHVSLIEAAETERRLPPARRKQKMACWPDYPLDWHGYGWTQAGEVMLRPTADQIDSLDYLVSLVVAMDEEDRRIIWAAAHSAAFRHRGPQWTKITKILGLNDPRMVKRQYKDALIKLWYRL
jgi:hypothetical protein